MTNYEFYKDKLSFNNNESYGRWCQIQDIRCKGEYCKGVRCDVCKEQSKKWLKEEHVKTQIKENQKVAFEDYIDIVYSILAVTGMTKIELSRQLGKEESYVSCVLQHKRKSVLYTTYTEMKVIANRYGIEC